MYNFDIVIRNDDTSTKSKTLLEFHDLLDKHDIPVTHAVIPLLLEDDCVEYLKKFNMMDS